MNKLIIAFGFGIILAGGHASAQEKTPTLAQAKAAFEKADTKLNQAYGDVKASIQDWKFEYLKKDQKTWLVYRDRRAEQAAIYNDGQEFENRPKDSPTYWQTLADLSIDRIEMISGWKLKTEDDETPWTGVWKDGQGGWMGIFADKSGKTLHFQIGVVRGPTYHTGDISGKAIVNNSMAFFTDKGTSEKPAGEPETWLVFTKEAIAPQVEIKGVNTMFYHGMRAYFDGTYTRVGDLDQKGTALILEGKSPFEDESDEPR